MPDQANQSRDLSKGYLPVVMVVAVIMAISAFIGSAAYTIGGVIKSIEYDRRETTIRFAQLEASIAKVQAILENRQCPEIGRK